MSSECLCENIYECMQVCVRQGVREKCQELWVQEAVRAPNSHILKKFKSKSSCVHTHTHTRTADVSVCLCSISELARCLGKLCGGERGTGQTPINFWTWVYKAWHSCTLRFLLLLTCFRSQIQLRACCLACSVDLFVLFIFSIFKGERF